MFIETDLSELTFVILFLSYYVHYIIGYLNLIYILNLLVCTTGQ